MPVLVLGMHRSGTSVLTRVVSLLGFDTGPDDLLIGPHETNVSGHWEVAHLTAFNDELLEHVGARWSAPPLGADAELAALAAGEWGERAREEVARAFSGSSWVWKDPRLCVLASFWRSVLGDDGLSVVVALRHPVEVARSLSSREGMSIDFGLAVWERYQRAVLRGVVGLPTYVVAYDDLLAEPERVVDDLDRFLPGARSPVPDDVRSAVEPAQRHHRAEEDRPLPASVASLHDLAMQHRGPHEAFPPLELAPETPNLQLAFEEHHRLVPYRDLWVRAQPYLDELLRRRDEVDQLRAQLDALEATRAVRLHRRFHRTPREEVPEVPTTVDP